MVVDAVYSMDGDIADLPEISRLCRSSGAWLMVDEAHSTGVLGATGRGIEEHFALPSDTIDIKMGTLSKAVPSAGGYIAGSRKLIDFLHHQARGFIYSGSLGAAATAAALEAINIIAAEPDRIHRLHENIAYFAHGLEEAGFSHLDRQTAIFPILCGDDWKALQMARDCQRRGVYIQAIPYPVVPKGMARLRASVMATHSISDLNFCVSVLQESATTVGGIAQVKEPEHK